MRHPRRLGPWATVAGLVSLAAGAVVWGLFDAPVTTHPTTSGAAIRTIRAAAAGTSSTATVPATPGPTRPAPRSPVVCPTPPPSVPGLVGGSYCGPTPTSGNGDGPEGECTGGETAPPCGPGAVAGQYYDYTLPQSCTGVVEFDGRQWVSELPPPSDGPPIDVWMELQPTGQRAGWISPRGAVGFQPDDGQPLRSCSAPTPAPEAGAAQAA
jgi:hypothetical protein